MGRRMSLADDDLTSDESLHRRLVAGDATAPAELALRFLDPLIAWLRGRNRVPQEVCVEAAEDAWLALVKSPTTYDPARGKSLEAYLRMSAQGDLANLLRRES